MNLFKFLLAGIALFSAIPGSAQESVDSNNRYERILAIVPVVGKGTADDPRRPLYAPGREAEPWKGIISWSAHYSDDGKFALVELVALDRAAFAPIVSEKRSDVKLVEKGSGKVAALIAEFQKITKDFDPAKIGVALP